MSMLLPNFTGKGQALQVVLPLGGPGKPPGRKSPKMGKNYKIPLPGPTPENGENCPKKGVNLLRKYNFCNFCVIVPHFRGSIWGGEFCNFAPFFGDFRPGGIPGPLGGKTTRNPSLNLAKIETFLRKQVGLVR